MQYFKQYWCFYFSKAFDPTIEAPPLLPLQYKSLHALHEVPCWLNSSNRYEQNINSESWHHQ